jgi:hypothetical protein
LRQELVGEAELVEIEHHRFAVEDTHDHRFAVLVGTVLTRRSSSLPCTRSMMRPSCGRRRSAMLSLAMILTREITAAVELAGGDSTSCSTPSMR